MPKICCASLLFLLSAAGAHAAEKPKGFMIESIDGGKTVTVRKGKEDKELPAGTELIAGDRIKTGDQVSAVVQYPDGSKVTVHKNSDFES